MKMQLAYARQPGMAPANTAPNTKSCQLWDHNSTAVPLARAAGWPSECSLSAAAQLPLPEPACVRINQTLLVKLASTWLHARLAQVFSDHVAVMYWAMLLLAVSPCSNSAWIMQGRG